MSQARGIQMGLSPGYACKGNRLRSSEVPRFGHAVLRGQHLAGHLPQRGIDGFNVLSLGLSPRARTMRKDY